MREMHINSISQSMLLYFENISSTPQKNSSDKFKNKSEDIDIS